MNNSKNKTIISALFIVYCSLSIRLFAPSPTLAQSLSLSISPPIVELMIQPGRQITMSYQLTNNSERNLQITPIINKFIPKAEDGLIEFTAVPRDNPITLAFDSGEKVGQAFELMVGETKQLVLKITVGSNAPARDYYWTLLFSSGDIGNKTGNQTGSVTQIGSNLLITVSPNGEPSLSGTIASLTVPKIIDSFSPIDIDLRIKNTGNTLFKPFGKVTLTGWFNQKREVSLLEQNILAGSVRRFPVHISRPDLPVGIFTIKTEFQPNQIPPAINNSTTIYYLPYKLVGGVLFLLVSIKVIRRIKRRVAREIGQDAIDKQNL